MIYTCKGVSQQLSRCHLQIIEGFTTAFGANHQRWKKSLVMSNVQSDIRAFQKPESPLRLPANPLSPGWDDITSFLVEDAVRFTRADYSFDHEIPAGLADMISGTFQDFQGWW